MKFNQIFCNHIWETQNIRLINQSIRYILETPIGEKRTYLVESRCVKCGRILKEEEIKERHLSVQETKELMEQDKLNIGGWDDK